MALWIIGDALFLVVVIPVVVVLLHRLLLPALEIRRCADALAEQGGELPSRLEALGELERTPGLAEDVGAGLIRYRRALDEVRPHRS